MLTGRYWFVSCRGAKLMLQNKKDNDNWDRVVNDFLDLVAPLALTREAVKALEWLIRRFKYNPDSSIFLPLESIYSPQRPRHSFSLSYRIILKTFSFASFKSSPFPRNSPSSPNTLTYGPPQLSLPHPASSSSAPCQKILPSSKPISPSSSPA